MGNRTYTNKLLHGDRSEHYGYDNRDRLTGMDRGVLAGDNSGVQTPLNHGTLANKEQWVNLDRRGNWLDYRETTGSAPTRRLSEVDAMNEYTCIAPSAAAGASQCTTQPSVTPDYDDAGNMTLDPLGRVIGDGTSASGQKYEYDDEMRVKAIRRAGDNKMLLEIAYDAIGRRAETIEHIDPQSGTLWDGQSGHPSPRHTRHVYDGLETVEEYVCCEGGSCGSNPPSCGNGWALVREFVWGGRFPEPIAMVDHTDAGVQSAGVEEVFHYLHDVLGSIIGLTNGAGTVFERYTYDPYGRTLAEYRSPSTGYFERNIVNDNYPTYSALGNPFMWTGQRFDGATGTYHFLFRTYSPQLGRWLQRDPIEYDAGSVNLYEYVLGNPMSWVDPWGLDPKSGQWASPDDFGPDPKCKFQFNKDVQKCKDKQAKCRPTAMLCDAAGGSDLRRQACNHEFTNCVDKALNKWVECDQRSKKKRALIHNLRIGIRSAFSHAEWARDNIDFINARIRELRIARRVAVKAFSGLVLPAFSWVIF